MALIWHFTLNIVIFYGLFASHLHEVLRRVADELPPEPWRPALLAGPLEQRVEVAGGDQLEQGVLTS